MNLNGRSLYILGVLPLEKIRVWTRYNPKSKSPIIRSDSIELTGGELIYSFDRNSYQSEMNVGDGVESIEASRLLYDEVSQLLYSFILVMQSNELQKLDGSIKDHFEDLKCKAVELSNAIRLLASSSYYHHLSTFGFLTAIRRWSKQIESEHGICVEVVSEGIEENERMPVEIERVLFATCREWIQLSMPIMNHSQPLGIRVVRENGCIQVVLHAPDLNVASSLLYAPLLTNNKRTDMSRYHGSIRFLVHPESGVNIEMNFQM